MSGTSIFDFSFLDYLNENHNLNSGSTEQDTPYNFSSDPGHYDGSGEAYIDPEMLENQIGPENRYFYEHDKNRPENAVVAVAAAVASASINSTLSAISTTLGIDEFLTTPFSNDEDIFNENSSLNHDAGFGSTASYYGSVGSAFSGGGPTSLTEDHDTATAPLLKIASSVIPENFKKMSTNSRNCVIAYVILFCIGAPGNLFVFISVGREIWRRQLMRSRIKVLIWHLATADLFVTFVVIPIEVFWRLTIQWYGGDPLCKLAQFFRAFGLYLSSTVIICISLDRFFAIVFPLKVIGGMKRVRNMLCVAWGSSIMFATPQILVFRVQSHPLYPSFLLCSNSDYFLSLSKEIMYNLLSLIVMYFAPLLVIIVTYAMVLFTIARKSREHHQDCRPRSGSNQLRRSDNASNITRAKRKTLWLSMVIVTVFVLCWTPYVGMTLWYMFDFETADKLVDPQIHEAFFVTAVSNSCVNPIIYGNYMKKYWKNLRNAACRSRNSSTSSSRIASSRTNNQHHQRTGSSYRCTNPNHHFTLSPRCHSSANASDVTIVLKELTTSQFLRGVATTTTTATTATSGTNGSRTNWFL